MIGNCLVQIDELPPGMRFGGKRHQAYRRRMKAKQCQECFHSLDKHYRASGCEGCKADRAYDRREEKKQQWMEEMGYVS